MKQALQQGLKTSCPKCGRVVNTGAAEGLCTHCLFLRAMGEGFDENLGKASTENGFDRCEPAGRRFGDYELLDLLGRGGMGMVHRARDLKLNRIVALKLTLTGEGASPDLVARFQNEAELAGKLDHPNIVSIYEVGEQDGQHYMSMKLVEGGSLAARIADRDLPLSHRESALLMARLARAVHYAHQRGIVHRDLKPSNVLLDADGTPYLTDFGLSKLLERDSGLTRTLAVVGTPGYMSPEQAAGNTKNLTTAVDVYGLGAVLYELLTNRPPFAGETTIQTIRQILDTEPTPPSQHHPRTPRDLEVICLKCLEKDPHGRYGSAEALAEDLERWLRHEVILARPSAPIDQIWKWIKRNPMRAALTASTLVASLALFIGMSAMSVRLATANRQITAKAEESHHRLVRLNIAAGSRGLREADYLRSLPWLVEALRLEQGDPAREDIHRFRINMALQHSPKLEQVLFHAGEVNAIDFSPDGGRLLTAGADRAARVWNLSTGEPAAAIMHGAAVSAARFSPDGRKVATTTLNGVTRLWDAATGRPVSPPLRHRQFKRISSRYHAVIWFSPEGRYLLSAYGSPDAHLWDAATGRRIRSFTHPDVVYDAAFNADASRIITACADGKARVWNTTDGTLAGPELLHRGVVGFASFSSDGQRALTVADRRIVQVWDWAAGRAIGAPITHSNQLNALFAVQFSPDGRRVLTASWDNTARVWDATTGQLISRLNHNGGILSAAFSPDSRSVATACWDGTARIWSATSEAPVTSAMPQGGSLLSVVFSANGTHLATASVNGTVRVWDVRTSDSAGLRLPHDGSAWAEFSPDQRRILTTSGERKGGARLWDAQTGAPLTPLLLSGVGVDKAAFTQDGSLFLTVSRDKTVRIWNTEHLERPPQELVHTTAVSSATFSPDGKRVLTVSGDAVARVWDATTGDRALRDLVHNKPILCAQFSPTGHLIATTSKDGTARLWSAATGEPKTAPLQHSSAVRQAVFNRSGLKLATVCAGRFEGGAAGGGDFVQVWDVETGRAATPEMVHPGLIFDITFSPGNDRRLATAATDGAARIWDAVTGAPLTPPLWYPSSVRQVLFSPNGAQLAGASEDGTVFLWDALTGELAAPAFQNATEHDKIRIDFSANGKRLLIARAREVVWVRDLAKTERPLEELILEAQVLSAHRIDPAAGQVPLDLNSLSNAWQRLRAIRRSTLVSAH